MSTDIVDILSPDTERFGELTLRKPTAGTLSLCDFAKLKITSGGESEVPFFEAIAFFYIHSHSVGDIRVKLFDKSLGVDENGCSLVFINEVIAWADEVELGSISEMGEKIGAMLNEAMNPKVEPKEDNKKVDDDDIAAIVSDDPKKKKEEPAPQPS